MQNISKNALGIVFFVSSLSILFLINTPLNLSIVPLNENQGFAFVWGQCFLLWHEIAEGRGLIFVSLYSLILKIFGFNTYSIIASHIIGTLVLMICSYLIYLILKQITGNSLYGGIASLIWVLIIITPIDTQNSVVELRSHLNLNEENLCVLFSLCSILLLVKSDLFRTNPSLIISLQEKYYLVTAGFFSICSLMSKGNGAILTIGFTLFTILTLFKNKKIISKIVFFYLGAIASLLIFNLILYTFDHDLISYWKDYFFVGKYTDEHFHSLKSMLKNIIIFLTRSSFSPTNLAMHSLAIILFIICIVKFMFSSRNNLFNLLISIWGIGNACVIIIPGQYQPYYYHLIWPSIAIIFSILLNNLSKKIKKYFIFILVFMFGVRILFSVPVYYDLTKKIAPLFIFNQRESFEDPVSQLSQNSIRQKYGFLKFADKINLLLPNKSDTFYIFNLHESIGTALTPLTYVYSKRYSPTTVPCGLLQVRGILGKKVNKLKTDLLKRPPKLLIVAETNFIPTWQANYISEFLSWFDNYIKNNYIFLESVTYFHLNENRTEKFNLFWIKESNQ